MIQGVDVGIDARGPNDLREFSHSRLGMWIADSRRMSRRRCICICLLFFLACEEEVVGATVETKLNTWTALTVDASTNLAFVSATIANAPVGDYFAFVSETEQDVSALESFAPDACPSPPFFGSCPVAGLGALTRHVRVTLNEAGKLAGNLQLVVRPLKSTTHMSVLIARRVDPRAMLDADPMTVDAFANAQEDDATPPEIAVRTNP